MRILFLASSDSIHSHKWIDFFASQGHEICWVSLTPEAAPTNPDIAYHTLSVSMHPLKLLQARQKFRRIIDTFQPDIMHVHSVGTYGLVGWLSGFPHKVLTAWGSDVLLNKDKFIIGWLVRRILKQAKLITTDAHHMVDVMRGIGVKDVPIELINFGIDTQKFSPQKVSAAVRKRYHIADATNIISMRNFDDIYDIPTFIRAAKIIYQARPDVRFYLGGRGPEKDNLEALVTELGLQDVIHFLGFVDNNELPQLLSAMHIYISTSPTDAGIAASTAEAMACGVYSVVSDVVDNAHWVVAGKTGSLFEVGDARDLAEKTLEALAFSEEDRAQITLNARQMILDKNDYHNEMRKMDDLLHQFQVK